VVNIPPTLKGLPQGFSAKDVAGQEEYEDIQEGINDFKTPGYRGPMPPKGEQHFEYRVYALDCKVKLGHKVGRLLKFCLLVLICLSCPISQFAIDLLIFDSIWSF
jgi:phosphatidylethanolamine-binding protein (PEBP) family uncharacterized protein